MTEKDLRKKLSEALKKNNETDQIIPDADGWDIAIMRGNKFIAGIELKLKVKLKETMKVENWHSKHINTKHKNGDRVEEPQLIEKFGNIWYKDQYKDQDNKNKKTNKHYKVEKPQEFKLGTVVEIEDTWCHQNGDALGQATTYYLYSESSSPPEKVLTVEVVKEKEEKEEKEEYKYRVSNITKWVIGVKNKQSQKEKIISPPKEIKITGEERNGNLNKIAKEIYTHLDC